MHFSIINVNSIISLRQQVKLRSSIPHLLLCPSDGQLLSTLSYLGMYFAHKQQHSLISMNNEIICTVITFFWNKIYNLRV